MPFHSINCHFSLSYFLTKFELLALCVTLRPADFGRRRHFAAGRHRLHGTGVGAARGGVVNSNYANKDTRIDDPQTEKEETQSSLGLHWLWPCQLCTTWDRS